MSDYYWELRVQKGYDPSQPRVPAGSPEGGRWTSSGEGRRTGITIGMIREAGQDLLDLTNKSGNEWGVQFVNENGQVKFSAYREGDTSSVPLGLWPKENEVGTLHTHPVQDYGPRFAQEWGAPISPQDAAVHLYRAGYTNQGEYSTVTVSAKPGGGGWITELRGKPNRTMAWEMCYELGQRIDAEYVRRIRQLPSWGESDRRRIMGDVIAEEMESLGVSYREYEL